MSLESGRKLGLISSLISIILPIIGIIGAIAIVIAVITNLASGIVTGTVTTPLYGLSVGLIAFLISVAAIGIAGFILFLVAMHNLANYYGEPSIFKKVLYAFILNIISATILVVYEFAFVFSSFSRLQTSTPSTTPALSILGILGISIIFAIVNAVLYMQAFNKLAEKSGVDNFKTTGLLYLIGTLLTIVLIGGLLVWIAWIFAAMGFNKLKPSPTKTPTISYTQPPPPSNLQTKRCPNCGTENLADALYCKSCGKPLP
jgi:uncharacterized membrane protein